MTSVSLKLSTASKIGFENQPLAICPPNITLLQKNKNATVSKINLSQLQITFTI